MERIARHACVKRRSDMLLALAMHAERPVLAGAVLRQHGGRRKPHYRKKMQQDRDSRENPASIARAALKRLAEEGVAPTPHHYRRAYFAESAHGAPLGSAALLQRLSRLPLAKSSAWPALRDALTREHWELALDLMAGMLLDAPPARAEPPATAALGPAMARFVREWARSQIGVSHLNKLQALQALEASAEPAELLATLQTHTARWAVLRERDAAPTEDAAVAAAEPWRRAWTDAVRMAEHAYAEQAQIHAQAGALLRQAGEVETFNDQLQAAARELWTACEHWETLTAQARARLLEVFKLLLDNVAELFEADHWVQPQVSALRELLREPPDVPRIEQAVGQLKDVLFRQGVLARAGDDARSIARELVEMVVRSLGNYVEHSARYGDELEAGLRDLDASPDWSRARDVVQGILANSRRMLDDTRQLRASFTEAQTRLEEAHARTRALEDELQSVSEMLQLDPLTGALNRRGLEVAFERETSRAQRGGDTLCVAMLDLDHFKRVNDTYGHDLGDTVLRELVRVARGELRPSDSIARMGGEEFMLILAGTTLDQAAQTVARLQLHFASMRFSHSHQPAGVQVGFSAGLAEWTAGETLESIYARADHALLQAKSGGRSRIELAA